MKLFKNLRNIVLIILVVSLTSGCSLINRKNRESAENVNSQKLAEASKEDEEKARLAAAAASEEKAREEAAAKAKQEQDAKAKEEEKAKQQQETKPNTQTPKPAAKAPSTNNLPNGVPAIPNKHPVEYLSSIENEVLVLVNAERAKVGLKPLVMNESLRTVCRYKANEMLQYGYFEHTSPYTGDPWALAKSFGYTYSSFGENIQMGKSSSGSYLRTTITAEALVKNWMNSEGHKKNLLDGRWTTMGIGIAYSTDGFHYESQMFSN